MSLSFASLVFVLITLTAAPAQALPKDFQQTHKTSKFKLPIGMVWIDNDRALILSRDGVVSIAQPKRQGFPSNTYLTVRLTQSLLLRFFFPSLDSKL
jgi:hypothetical protein